ncbi:MAG: hypothetical protein U0003_05980 [Vampirovibrionales bacterium]
MSALLLTVLGWPYWKGLLHHAPVEQLVGNATLTHSSIHSLLYYGFRTLAKALDPEWLAAAPWVFNGFKVLLAFVLLWAILWSLGSLLRANLPDAVSTTNSPSNRLIPAWSPLLTLLCVVVGIVSLKFYPWYVGMVLPAVFLLPQSHPLRSMVSAVALVQVLSITLLGQARMADCLLLLIIPALWAFKRLSKNTTLKAGA